MPEQAVEVTVTGANQFSSALELRGVGNIPFTVNQKNDGGGFVGTITLQVSEPGAGEWKDVESYTADSETPRYGDIVGSFDLRVGCKTGDYTSGQTVVTLKR